MTRGAGPRAGHHRLPADAVTRGLIHGKGYEDQGLVFAPIDGPLWSPYSFSGYWRRLIKRSKLDHVRFHGLRHTTIALNARYLLALA